MQSLDSFQGEKISLFHIIKRRMRREKRTITQVTDLNGRKHTSSTAIIETFVAHFEQKFQQIQVDEACVKSMVEAGHLRLPEDMKEIPDGPLTSEELRCAVDKGEKKKAPGRDGISSVFFQVNWEVMKDDLRKLFSEMFLDRKLTAQQKHGVIVLCPKNTSPVVPADYRPITLLNNDYKIMARIIAGRLKPVLADLLHPSQHCGVPGRTIFEAVATVRDAIAHAERANTPLCVISLDFKEAFDKISHSYLFSVLQSYGFSKGFIDRIKHMYTDVTSVVQVNGNTSRPIPIHCSICQGCPLSMALFTLCLNPFLHHLDQHLQGTQIH